MQHLKTLRSKETITALQWQPGITFPGMVAEVPPLQSAHFGDFPAHALLFDGNTYVNALPGEWIIFGATGFPCMVWPTMGNYEGIPPISPPDVVSCGGRIWWVWSLMNTVLSGCHPPEIV